MQKEGSGIGKIIIVILWILLGLGYVLVWYAAKNQCCLPAEDALSGIQAGPTDPAYGSFTRSGAVLPITSIHAGVPDPRTADIRKDYD